MRMSYLEALFGEKQTRSLPLSLHPSTTTEAETDKGFKAFSSSPSSRPSHLVSDVLRGIGRKGATRVLGCRAVWDGAAGIPAT